jgi:diguanylate cyclase (GGDEF)-like protein
VSDLDGEGAVDDLTGLPNRRRWMAVVQGALREGATGSVLVCDLDRLSALNETYGRPTGDLVLTELAMILSHHGQSGRLGEDGFALWLPGQTSPASYAEFIVDEVAGAFRDSTGLQVSVSVGAAIAGRDLASTLERAHQALGAAKAAGGGRACYGHRLAA